MAIDHKKRKDINNLSMKAALKRRSGRLSKIKDVSGAGEIFKSIGIYDFQGLMPDPRKHDPCALPFS